MPATASCSSGDSFNPATHSACSIISGVTAGAFSAWAETARWKTAVPTPAAARASNNPRRVRTAGVGLLMAVFLREGRDGGVAKLLPGDVRRGAPADDWPAANGARQIRARDLLGPEGSPG